MVSLLENEPIREGASFIYPDQEIYSGGLIAEPAAGFSSSTDMVFGLFSPEALESFAGFGQVSENTVDTDNEQLYAYGRLLEELKGELPGGVIWSSSIIRVIGNKQ